MASAFHYISAYIWRQFSAKTLFTEAHPLCVPILRRKRELDKIDRNILRILQADGRISFTELGEKVGLSTTPCTERVRRLEREGIIMGYNARLNPQHLKGSLLVFVEISLDYKSGDTFEEFRRAVLKLPHVLECHLVSGISTTW